MSLIADSVFFGIDQERYARHLASSPGQKSLWDESEHAREPAGTTGEHHGGEFAKKDQPPQTGWEPKSVNAPDIGEAKKQGARRTRGAIHFEKPIVGPSGAALHNYNWMWTWEDGPEHDDPIRVSDWEMSEENPETGRQIVHHFGLSTPGSNEVKIVSLETALKAMGFGEDKAGLGKVKNLAMAAMQLAQQEQEHQRLLVSEEDKSRLGHEFRVQQSQDKIDTLKSRVRNLEKQAQIAAGGNNPDEHYRAVAGRVNELLTMFRQYPGFADKARNGHQIENIAKLAGETREDQDARYREATALWRRLNAAVNRNVLGEESVKTPVLEGTPAKLGRFEVKPWSAAKMKNWYFANGEEAEKAIEDADKWLSKHHPNHPEHPAHARLKDAQRDKRHGNSSNEANANYQKTGRIMPHSYLAEGPDGRIVQVDGSELSDVEYFQSRGYKPISEPLPKDYHKEDEGSGYGGERAVDRVRSILRGGWSGVHPDVQAQWPELAPERHGLLHQMTAVIDRYAAQDEPHKQITPPGHSSGQSSSSPGPQPAGKRPAIATPSPPAISTPKSPIYGKPHLRGAESPIEKHQKATGLTDKALLEELRTGQRKQLVPIGPQAARPVPPAPPKPSPAPAAPSARPVPAQTGKPVPASAPAAPQSPQSRKPIIGSQLPKPLPEPDYAHRPPTFPKRATGPLQPSPASHSQPVPKTTPRPAAQAQPKPAARPEPPITAQVVPEPTHTHSAYHGGQEIQLSRSPEGQWHKLHEGQWRPFLPEDSAKIEAQKHRLTPAQQPKATQPDPAPATPTAKPTPAPTGTPQGPAAPQATGSWREVGPQETLKPGQKIRMNVTTGKSEVFEPQKPTAPPAPTVQSAPKAPAQPPTSGQPTQPQPQGAPAQQPPANPEEHARKFMGQTGHHYDRQLFGSTIRPSLPQQDLDQLNLFADKGRIEAQATKLAQSNMRQQFPELKRGTPDYNEKWHKALQEARVDVHAKAKIDAKGALYGLKLDYDHDIAPIVNWGRRVATAKEQAADQLQQTHPDSPVVKQLRDEAQVYRQHADRHEKETKDLIEKYTGKTEERAKETPRVAYMGGPKAITTDASGKEVEHAIGPEQLRAAKEAQKNRQAESQTQARVDKRVQDQSELFQMKPDEYRKHMEAFEKSGGGKIENRESGAYHDALKTWLKGKGVKPHWDTRQEMRGDQLTKEAVKGWQDVRPSLTTNQYHDIGKQAMKQHEDASKDSVSANLDARKQLMKSFGLREDQLEDLDERYEDELPSEDTEVRSAAFENPGSILGDPNHPAWDPDTAVQQARKLLTDKSLTGRHGPHTPQYHQMIDDYINQHGGLDAVLDAQERAKTEQAASPAAPKVKIERHDGIWKQQDKPGGKWVALPEARQRRLEARRKEVENPHSTRPLQMDVLKRWEERKRRRDNPEPEVPTSESEDSDVVPFRQLNEPGAALSRFAQQFQEAALERYGQPDRMSLEHQLLAVLDRYTVHSSPGQRMLWGPEQEQQHPREHGRWAHKPGGGQHSNEDLVSAYQSGEREAGGQLVEQNQGIIHNLVRRYARSPSDVDDLTQEARIAVLDAARLFDPQRGYKFTTLLTVAVQNRLGNLVGRKQKRSKVWRQAGGQGLWGDPDTPQPEPTVEPEETPTEHEEQRQAVLKAVESLPEQQQEVVRRRYGIGRPPQNGTEIAAQVGLTKQRVSQILSEAAETMRAAIKDRYSLLWDQVAEVERCSLASQMEAALERYAMRSSPGQHHLDSEQRFWCGT